MKKHMGLDISLDTLVPGTRGQTVGLNFPNTSQKSYLCDPQDYFLWPQNKHLQFSINNYSDVTVNVKHNKHYTNLLILTITRLQFEITLKQHRQTIFWSCSLCH
jgi:hypothetical protein